MNKACSSLIEEPQKPSQHVLLYEEMDEEANGFDAFMCKLRLFRNADQMPNRLSRSIRTNFKYPAKKQAACKKRSD